MALAFQIIVILCGLIALATGANEVLKGAKAKGDFGDLGDYTAAPLLNYTIRFLGAIWMGFGALLIVFATNPVQYQLPLAVGFVFVMIGGAGRLLSLHQNGFPAGQQALVYQTLSVELVLIPILLVWLYVGTF